MLTTEIAFYDTEQQDISLPIIHDSRFLIQHVNTPTSSKVDRCNCVNTTPFQAGVDFFKKATAHHLMINVLPGKAVRG